MLKLTLRRHFADDDIESEKPTASRRFTRVLDHLNFEYDLPNDVQAEAEAVLQAIEGEEKEMNTFHMDQPAQSRWRSRLLQTALS